MTIKQRLLNVYYTSQAGYNFLSWLVAMLAYASIGVLVIHFILPNVSSELIAMATPFIGFVLFYIFGYHFIKRGGYQAQQTFGGKKNPNRLNWEMEYRKALMDLEFAKTLKATVKKLDPSIDTTELEKRTKEFDDFKEDMAKMLAD